MSGSKRSKFLNVLIESLWGIVSIFTVRKAPPIGVVRKTRLVSILIQILQKYDVDK